MAKSKTKPATPAKPKRATHGYAVLVNGVQASTEASQAKAWAVGINKQRNGCRVIVQELGGAGRAWELMRDHDGRLWWHDVQFANTTRTDA